MSLSFPSIALFNGNYERLRLFSHHRLEVATRELTRISELNPAGGGPNSRLSPAASDALRLPDSTLSLQRSIDQLRAASARIDRVLDSHLAPSVLERLQASRASPPSPSSSPPPFLAQRPSRSSRSAFRPPLTTLSSPPGLSPYRPFAVRTEQPAPATNASPASPTSPSTSSGHYNSAIMGLSAGLMSSSSSSSLRRARSTSSTRTPISDSRPEVPIGEDQVEDESNEEDETVSTRRVGTAAYQLDRNGDPLAQGDDETKNKPRRRTRELIGR